MQGYTCFSLHPKTPLLQHLINFYSRDTAPHLSLHTVNPVFHKTFDTTLDKISGSHRGLTAVSLGRQIEGQRDKEAKAQSRKTSLIDSFVPFFLCAYVPLHLCACIAMQKQN
jgi:hypothetical protein